MAVNQENGSVGALYEALTERAFDRAAECVAENVLLLNVATGDVYRGRTGFLEFNRGWLSAFPDARFELLNLAVAGERVIAEYELAGTHTGPLVTPRGYVPPTGMNVQLRICDVLELATGTVVTHIRTYFDSLTLLRQLGLITGSPLHAPERRSPLELYAHTTDEDAHPRNKAIVHRFFQDVFNRQDPGAAADTCGQEFYWHGGTLGESRSLAAYQQVLGAFFAAFPDLQVTVLDTVAEGDRVVVRLSMTGTHRGEFQGVAPTHHAVRGDVTNTYRIEENRIVEEWWQGDLLALLQQINAAPATVPLFP